MTRKNTPLFTEAETAAIGSAALQVWNEIAFDVMGGEPDGMGLKSIPRSHVIELVADAGRLEQQLRRDGRFGARRGKVTDPALDYFSMADRVNGLGMKGINKLLKPFFQYARYE